MQKRIRRSSFAPKHKHELSAHLCFSSLSLLRRWNSENVGIDPARYGCVALHGTGTPLGDPIEVGALGQALAQSTENKTNPPIHIGSVKSCYGHSEGAAGLTGTILAIKAISTQVRVN